MKIKFKIIAYLVSTFLLMTTTVAHAKTTEDNQQQVYELHYIEQEPGVDAYQVTMLVSDGMIRIDEVDEDSGYIIYDDTEKKIYSVSHTEQSTLVINQHIIDSKDSPAETKVEYKQLSDAPTVGGEKIYNYRVYTIDKNIETNCMELQIAEDLLPKVQKILKNYQALISGQQVKMTNNLISEEQTACFFADQIYNTGEYYDKGLPIQEWHSNDRSKILKSYKQIKVNKNLFDVPKSYKQFSIDNNSKTFIK